MPGRGVLLEGSQKTQVYPNTMDTTTCTSMITSMTSAKGRWATCQYLKRFCIS